MGDGKQILNIGQPKPVQAGNNVSNNPKKKETQPAINSKDSATFSQLDSFYKDNRIKQFEQKVNNRYVDLGPIEITREHPVDSLADVYKYAAIRHLAPIKNAKRALRATFQGGKAIPGKIKTVPGKIKTVPKKLQDAFEKFNKTIGAKKTTQGLTKIEAWNELSKTTTNALKETGMADDAAKEASKGLLKRIGSGVVGKVRGTGVIKGGFIGLDLLGAGLILDRYYLHLFHDQKDLKAVDQIKVVSSKMGYNTDDENKFISYIKYTGDMHFYDGTVHKNQPQAQATIYDFSGGEDGSGPAKKWEGNYVLIPNENAPEAEELALQNAEAQKKLHDPNKVLTDAEIQAKNPCEIDFNTELIYLAQDLKLFAEHPQSINQGELERDDVQECMKDIGEQINAKVKLAKRLLKAKVNGQLPDEEIMPWVQAELKVALDLVESNARFYETIKTNEVEKLKKDLFNPKQLKEAPQKVINDPEQITTIKTTIEEIEKHKEAVLKALRTKDQQRVNAALGGKKLNAQNFNNALQMLENDAINGHIEEEAENYRKKLDDSLKEIIPEEKLKEMNLLEILEALKTIKIEGEANTTTEVIKTAKPSTTETHTTTVENSTESNSKIDLSEEQIKEFKIKRSRFRRPSRNRDFSTQIKEQKKTELAILEALYDGQYKEDGDILKLLQQLLTSQNAISPDDINSPLMERVKDEANFSKALERVRKYLQSEDPAAFIKALDAQIVEDLSKENGDK